MLNFLSAKSHLANTKFEYLDWITLVSKVQEPNDLGEMPIKEAKEKSEIIAATDAPNKQKKTILLHDNFTLLRLDLDNTPLDIVSISTALDDLLIESFIIHTTINHLQKDNGNRYRVYIFLEHQCKMLKSYQIRT